MRSFTACHIPDWQSHVQIGFDQILPLASSTRELGMRLPIFEVPNKFMFIQNLSITLPIGKTTDCSFQAPMCHHYLFDYFQRYFYIKLTLF